MGNPTETPCPITKGGTVVGMLTNTRPRQIDGTGVRESRQCLFGDHLDRLVPTKGLCGLGKVLCMLLVDCLHPEGIGFTVL